jgi:hypothetical protein
MTLAKSMVLCYTKPVNAGGCLIGSTLTTVAVAVWRVIKVVGGIIAKVIYYFGLHAPLFYILYGLILKATLGLDMFGSGTDSRLYMLGFLLSIVLGGVLLVRNLLVKPYRKFFKRTGVVEYGGKQRLSPTAPEAPKIYKSKVNAGIIVYEYKNRYDLYEKMRDGSLEKVGTEMKKR